jgi:hypothetical protein
MLLHPVDPNSSHPISPWGRPRSSPAPVPVPVPVRVVGPWSARIGWAEPDLESSSVRCAFVMYRRSALGSARFHAPAVGTTPLGSVAFPDNHPDFETVGLDEEALTQVRFSKHVVDKC